MLSYMFDFVKSYLRLAYKSPKLFFRFYYHPLYKGRKKVASRHLRGRGIEIGALAFPLAPIFGAKKTYIDNFSKEELNRRFPKFGRRIFYPDIIDNGETLHKIPDESLDFIYASHFLEHCEDPVSTVENHVAKLKKGGQLVYIVPDHTNPMDKDRSITPIEHFLEDYKNPHVSKQAHLEDVTTHTYGLERGTPEFDKQVEELRELNGLMHCHVFDLDSYKGFLNCLTERLGNVNVEEVVSNPKKDVYEHIAILKKA